MKNEVRPAGQPDGATPDAGALITDARRSAGLTLRALAERAGTSASTLHAYERGAKEPRLSTLARIIGAAGGRLRAAADMPAPLHAAPTRADRRSLYLNQLVVEELRRHPTRVLAKARENLAHLRRVADTGTHWLDEWERVLDGPIEDVVALLQDPGEHGCDMRQMSPFAGVVPHGRRWEAIREMRRMREQGL